MRWRDDALAPRLISVGGGGAPWPGHAVNPSMGARSAHPCASRSWPGCPTAARQFPARAAAHHRAEGIALEKQRAGHCPALCFCSCSCFPLPPRRRGELSSAGRQAHAGPLAPWASRMRLAGWAGRPTPVLPCAQDSAREQGAIEPPWMGLRRVLHGPAYPRHAGTINAPQRPLST